MDNKFYISRYFFLLFYLQCIFNTRLWFCWDAPASVAKQHHTVYPYRIWLNALCLRLCVHCISYHPVYHFPGYLQVNDTFQHFPRIWWLQTESVCRGRGQLPENEKEGKSFFNHLYKGFDFISFHLKYKKYYNTIFYCTKICTIYRAIEIHAVLHNIFSLWEILFIVCLWKLNGFRNWFELQMFSNLLCLLDCVLRVYMCFVYTWTFHFSDRFVYEKSY